MLQSSSESSSEAFSGSSDESSDEEEKEEEEEVEEQQEDGERVQQKGIAGEEEGREEEVIEEEDDEGKIFQDSFSELNFPEPELFSVRCHINTHRKLTDWNLRIEKKWIILGDSNLCKFGGSLSPCLGFCEKDWKYTEPLGGEGGPCLWH